MTINMMTIVGARPQFVKAAMVSRALKNCTDIEQMLVHTGQHFDPEMSDRFFDEMDIPRPDLNLGISGGSHAQMTGKMMEAIERVVIERSPDVVLVYGDTNSTLAGALAATKCGVPVCHAEAGYRMRLLSNPEEVNRVCVDHVSALLFAPTEFTLKALEGEGLADRTRFTGDLMYDAFVYYARRIPEDDLVYLQRNGEPFAVPDEFYYLTCHRQENSSIEVLRTVLRTLDTLGVPVVYPVHPRMDELVDGIIAEGPLENIALLKPVGYFESINLVQHCAKVITDSGGLQREAFYAEKKCITLLPFALEETLVDRRNSMVNPLDQQSILGALALSQFIDPSYQPYGDGNAAQKMIDAIREEHEGGKLLMA